MLRTRLVWFTVGFSASGAAIANFLWRDFWTERSTLSAHMKQKFEELEARVQNLESIPPHNANPTVTQVDG